LDSLDGDCTMYIRLIELDNYIIVRFVRITRINGFLISLLYFIIRYGALVSLLSYPLLPVSTHKYLLKRTYIHILMSYTPLAVLYTSCTRPIYLAVLHETVNLTIIYLPYWRATKACNVYNRYIVINYRIIFNIE